MADTVDISCYCLYSLEHRPAEMATKKLSELPNTSCQIPRNIVGIQNFILGLQEIEEAGFQPSSEMCVEFFPVRGLGAGHFGSRKRMLKEPKIAEAALSRRPCVDQGDSIHEGNRGSQTRKRPQRQMVNARQRPAILR